MSSCSSTHTRGVGKELSLDQLEERLLITEEKQRLAHELFLNIEHGRRVTYPDPSHDRHAISAQNATRDGAESETF